MMWDLKNYNNNKNEDSWLSLLRPVLVGVEGSVSVLKVTDFAVVRANSLAKDSNTKVHRYQYLGT